MKIETLKDVLHWTVNLHRRLARYLARYEDRVHDERAGLLLDFLEQHENRLAQVVSRFEESASDQALHTWCYEYFEKNPVLLEQIDGTDYDTADIQSVMSRIIDQHNQVIELYRYLHAQAGAASAKELLQSLITLEEHEAMQMVMGNNRLQDV
ncbi:ATPase [Marinobacterium stanieri]|uniref:ATPase n=1 Tax=Marinobacterium stanieri TaxID=49186 RepID=UPI003A94C553